MAVLARHHDISTQGDLTGAIDAYFDTRVGPKRVPSSYRRVAAKLGLEEASVLFVPDTLEELDAAAESGMGTALCDRSSSAPRAEAHPVVGNFDELEPILTEWPGAELGG